jgi:hypothetical protein
MKFLLAILATVLAYIAACISTVAESGGLLAVLFSPNNQLL